MGAALTSKPILCPGGLCDTARVKFPSQTELFFFLQRELMTVKSSDCLSSSSSNPITTQTFVWASALAMEMPRDKAWITAGVNLPVNFMLCGFQAQFINCRLTCEVLALVLK